MKNNRSGIVIAIILLVLLAAGLYYFTREDGGETGDTTQGSAPQTEQSEPADASGESASGPDSDSDANEEQQQTGLRIPTFDVLRVEPDGTAVIAGAAEPLGVLDVKEGDTVVASSSVGDTGDFVAIIETPLTPGDHLIYLDVTMPDGRTARSLQTATISIPETPDGDLLALITEPGKASEIIASPDGDESAPKGTVIARAPGSSGEQENGGQTSGNQDRDGVNASDDTNAAGDSSAALLRCPTRSQPCSSTRTRLYCCQMCWSRRLACTGQCTTCAHQRHCCHQRALLALDLTHSRCQCSLTSGSVQCGSAAYRESSW